MKCYIINKENKQSILTASAAKGKVGDSLSPTTVVKTLLKKSIFIIQQRANLARLMVMCVLFFQLMQQRAAHSADHS